MYETTINCIFVFMKKMVIPVNTVTHWNLQKQDVKAQILTWMQSKVVGDETKQKDVRCGVLFSPSTCLFLIVDR